MVNYICYRCGWTICHKTKMKNHLSRKNTCKDKLNKINIDDCKIYILSGKSYEEYINITKHVKNVTKCVKNVTKIKQNVTENNENNKFFECKFCEKNYKFSQSLSRHYKNCKEKKKEEEAKNSMDELVKILNNQIKDFKKELNKRDKQIDELIKKAGINNSNITQNIQNNIKLLVYKDTDISNITDKDIRSCMNHSNMCVPYLIKMIHLDPKKPENHNVYISNLKNGYIMVYDGDKWDTLNREEVIENMINDRECLIQDRVEDWLENGKNYPIIMKKFERYLEKKEKDVVLNKIKEEIRFMLFNNRNIIKNNNPEADKSKLVIY